MVGISTGSHFVSCYTDPDRTAVCRSIYQYNTFAASFSVVNIAGFGAIFCFTDKSIMEVIDFSYFRTGKVCTALYTGKNLILDVSGWS